MPSGVGPGRDDREGVPSGRDVLVGRGQICHAAGAGHGPAEFLAVDRVCLPFYILSNRLAYRSWIYREPANLLGWDRVYEDRVVGHGLGRLSGRVQIC